MSGIARRQEEVGLLKHKHISKRDQSGIATSDTMKLERWQKKKERPRVKPDRLGYELSAIEKRMFEEHDKEMEEIERKRMRSLEELSVKQDRARRKHLKSLKELSVKRYIARSKYRESFKKLFTTQDIAIIEQHDKEMEEIEGKRMRSLVILFDEQYIARSKYMKSLKELSAKQGIAISEQHDKETEEIERTRMESLEELSARQDIAIRKYRESLKELSARQDIAIRKHRESLEELSAKQDIAISELHDTEMEEIERKRIESFEELSAKQDRARRKHVKRLKELSATQDIARRKHRESLKELSAKQDIAIREQRKRLTIGNVTTEDQSNVLCSGQPRDLFSARRLKIGLPNNDTPLDWSDSELDFNLNLDIMQEPGGFLSDPESLKRADISLNETNPSLQPNDLPNERIEAANNDSKKVNGYLERDTTTPLNPPVGDRNTPVSFIIDNPTGVNQGTLPIRQPPELGIYNIGTGVVHGENIESPISMKLPNESLTDKTQEPNGFLSELFAEYETISKTNELTKGENTWQEYCDESVTHKSENKTENSPKEFGKSHDDTDELLTETSASQDKIGKSQYETYELVTETGELQGGIGKLQEKTDELLAERGESAKGISKLQDETDELLVENGESQDGIGISQDETDEQLTEPGQPLGGIGKKQDETDESKHETAESPKWADISLNETNTSLKPNDSPNERIESPNNESEKVNGYHERNSTTPLNLPVGDRNTPVSFNIDVPKDDDAPIVFLYLQEEDKNLVKYELCTEGDHIPKIGDSCKIISKLYHLLPHGCRFTNPVHVKIKLDKRCQQDTNNTVVFYSATAPNEKPHWEMLTNNNKSCPERRIVCVDSETCTISMPTFCVLCVGECDQNESLRLIQTSQFDVFVGMRFEADHIVEGDTHKWLVKIRVFLSRNGSPIAGVHDWQTFPVVTKPIKGIQFGGVQIRVHDVKQDWTLDQEYNSEDRSVFQIETGKRSKAVFTYTSNNATSMDTFRAKVRLHQENARNDCELVLEDDCILGNLIINTVRLQTTGLGSAMGQQLNGVVNGLGASNTSTVNGAGANNKVSTANQGAAANISNSEVNSLSTGDIRMSFHKAFKAISDAVDRFPSDSGELEKLCRRLRVDRNSVVRKAADRCTSPSLLALLEWKDNTGGNLGILENLFREYVDR